jgi:hypothetical protein
VVSRASMASYCSGKVTLRTCGAGSAMPQRAMNMTRLRIAAAVARSRDHSMPRRGQLVPPTARRGALPCRLGSKFSQMVRLGGAKSCD